MGHCYLSAKARELSCYIEGTYGSNALGLVRLLSSVPYFRTAADKGSLSELLGMSLVSFDKFLREVHSLVLVYHGADIHLRRIDRDGGGGVVIYSHSDDSLRTVGGVLSRALRKIYAEANDLVSVPIMSLGSGLSVSSALAAINVEGVGNLVDKLDDTYISTADRRTINDHAKLVGDQPGEASFRYRYLNAVHNVFVALREKGCPIEEEKQLPFATADELMSVITGLLPRSVEPKEGATLPEEFLACLKKAYPKGEVVEGKFILKGLEAYDPFPLIGSVIIDTAFDLDSVADVTTPVPTPVVPAAVNQVIAPGVQSEPVLHVLKYHPENINAMSASERELALYGFIGGEKTYHQLSTALKGKLARLVGSGSHQPDFVISTIATAIKRGLGARHITDEHCGLMAAGRVVAWKGNWDVAGDLWSRH